MKYIRGAALQGFESAAAAVGLDLSRLMLMAGLEADAFSSPSSKVPINAALALLNYAAMYSGREDFALRLARGRGLSVLGPRAMLAYTEPTVRDAVKAIIRHQAVHANGARMRLEEQDGIALCHCQLDLDHNIPSRQGYELAVATIHMVLSLMMGPGWRPVRICFRHGPPVAATVHSAVFRTAIEFNSEADCVVFRSSDLDRKITTADPQFARDVRDYLQSVDTPLKASLQHEVRLLVDGTIGSGNCTAEAVARRLGLPLRTFYLRLKQEGASFAAIIDDVRRDHALRRLEAANASMTEISSLLGFSSLPAFSRWFRQRFGCTARDWMALREKIKTESHRTA